MRTLDIGAYGVIAPLVETPDAAKTLAQALHYPPRGALSWGPRRPAVRYGVDYLGLASESVVSMVMIETATGLANLDAILAVDGLDGVFIGPADLALALGRPPTSDPTDRQVVEAIEHIRRNCKATGKRVGLFCSDPAYARDRIDAGFDIVTLTPDLALMTRTAEQQVSAVRGR